MTGFVPTATQHRIGTPDDAQCGQRWTSGDVCAVAADGSHTCWRTTDHRTHICDCNAIKPATTTASPEVHRTGEASP
jgi:hypothetical protein